jgi:signal transduction histidine kinase
VNARERDIPVLDVVEDWDDAHAQAERLAQADDWVMRASVAAELPARVERLLRRRAPVEDPAAESAPPADGRFLALVIHDLRTPLNVISLSMRMIDQAVPKGDPELDEDLRHVEENFKQIEQMLSQMSDYYRLYEGDVRLSISEFSPRRFISELLEECARKASQKAPTVRLEVRDSCPAEVSFDQKRAWTAIQYALANASAAIKGGAVVLTLSGASDRWIIEVRTDQPPPVSVHSTELRPTIFERLCGSAAERRGMDLAIVARVTQLFGGTARLDVLPGGGTAIVLDWPARVPER